MSRYVKNKSKYILAKRHQDINQGTLYERDWVTIGNVHRLEPGKRPFYSGGNFIFTENDIPVYKKKRKSGKWVGEYTYEDVKDASSVVNQVKVNTDSENLTDYAYWGSMVELFRGSVEHIIKTFPGRLRSTKKRLMIHHHTVENNVDTESWEPADGYILGNPFKLDMHTEFDNVSEEELLRYIALSWRSYVMEDYDNDAWIPITSYTITSDPIQYDCEGRYFKLCWVLLVCEKYSLIIDVYLVDGEIVYCYKTNTETLTFLISYYTGLDGTTDGTVGDIRPEFIETIGRRDLPPLPEDFSIHPNEGVIENYFKTLEGFEWKLLNRKTKPYYQNTFLLPVQNKYGTWYLVRRKYTWPSEGYCIDIESTDYDSFINSMLSLSEVYDSIWCDAIWRCMVHESVKNFDWSYRREYEDNDANDNIDGGNRMKDVMHLYGIIYDTAKRYVDGIRMYNTITYDGYNNCPTALISDRNLLLGWDGTSTMHKFFWYEQLSGRIPSSEEVQSLPAVPVNVDEDSPELISVTCYGQYDAQYFVKKSNNPVENRLEESFFIPQNVDNQDNPWIPTNSYGRVYVEVGYSEVEGRDLSDYTYTDFPYQLFDGETYPEYVCVVNNNTTRYYKLLEGSDIQVNNENYINGTWFTNRNEESITPETADILFNRNLNLSARYIMKTKGTKEAIEMAFALFGFGLYDENENPYGDYTIDERYGTYNVKDYNETFYFYEEISEDDVVGEPVEYTSMPLDPTQSSQQYIKVTYNQGEETEYVLYYKLNGEHTVYDVIKLLYAHRITERDDDNYYAGVPLNDNYRGNTHLIVPFLDSKKNYEGDIYFEGNGGWMKNTEKSVYPFDYSETIPYLHILQRISDLFTIDTSGVNNGDIYFVADVSNYYEYSDNTPYYLSNFFKLKDKYNVSRFTSWVNIPIDGPIRFGNGYEYYTLDENQGVYSYVGPVYIDPSGDNWTWNANNTVRELPEEPASTSPEYLRIRLLFDGVTYEDYRHAKHLDDIIPTILFNNPHCGYGRYDSGAEYNKYMEFPYTYSVDNYMYDDDYYRNMASQFHFSYTETPGEKLDITADTYAYENGTKTNTGITPTYEYNLNDKFLKITLFDGVNGEELKTEQPDTRLHMEYMRNVVMKYVAQVVPSTTILVLENFISDESSAKQFATITTQVEGDGYAYGAGTYPKSTMVTLNAVPNEGYHFVRWTITSGRANLATSEEQELTVMVCGDKIYTAVFAENCDFGVGCKIVDCVTISND